MKKNKKLWLAVIGVAVALGLVVVGAYKEQDRDTKVKIGANLSLTGSMPYWSSQIKKGLDLALKNLSDGKISICYEDNRGNVRDAISAFRKLAEDDVSVIITAHTSIAVPQQILAQQEQTPLLGTVVGNSDFGEKNQWSFLDWPAHEDVVPPLVSYMRNKLKCRKAAILVVNDDYGSTGAKVFSNEFKAQGGQIEARESIGNTEKNLRPVLSKLLVEGVDSLYTITREETLLNIIKLSREMGFDGYIVGDHAMASSIIEQGLPVEISKIAFCGSVGIVEIDKASPFFVEQYVGYYNEKPDWVALYGYSIGEYLLDVIKKSGGDKDTLRKSLSMLSMDSLRGRVIMSETRKVQTSCVVYVRENGRFRMVK